MATKKRSWKELIAAIRRTFRLWKVGVFTIEPMEPPARRDHYHSPEQRKVVIRFLAPIWRLGEAYREIALVASSAQRAHDNLELLATVLEAVRFNRGREWEPLLMAIYRQLDPVAPAVVHPSPKPDATGPYAVLGVEPHYPLAIIEVIWKARLRVEHPDVGGDGAKAARLNRAMEEIREQKSR